MTSIQTTVDDEIADAFTAWATENYKVKPLHSAITSKSPKIRIRT